MKIISSVIEKAKKTALNSNVRKGKLGAVIFSKKGNIETFAPNTTFMMESEKRKTFTIHAEEFALIKAIKMKIFSRCRISDLALLVVRVKPSTGEFANAQPCEKCSVLLRESGIKAYYTDKQGKIRRFQ